MYNGKLYSVWIDGEPSPALSVYHDDCEAMAAFRHLILSVRNDQSKGIIDDATDMSMSLYCHGYMQPDGRVRGLIDPIQIMSGMDVQPESEGDCEVIE